MKLIVGLGNPGEKYIDTRHNVGFMVVDALALKLTGQPASFSPEEKFDAEVYLYNDLLLAKPQTFMNSSGEAVKKLTDYYKINIGDLYVIHDDLDLRLGSYKIQKEKGPRQHNGILSIEEKLNNKDFWRVRIGVDNRKEDARISGETYVLKSFSPDELVAVQSIIEEVARELISIFK